MNPKQNRRATALRTTLRYGATLAALWLCLSVSVPARAQRRLDLSPRAASPVSVPARAQPVPPVPPAAPVGEGGNAFSLVTGTVTYRDRSALPPSAVLRVRLEDTSRQDAASRLLAEVILPTNGRQVPLPFALPYKPAGIIADHRYQVRAQILVGGAMRYTSTTAYPVLTNGAPASVSVLVQASPLTSVVPVVPIPAPPSVPNAALEETYWKLVFLNGQTPLVPAPRGEPRMTLRKAGKKLTGTAGCNSLFGTYTAASGTIKFHGIGGTRMACPEPLMKQERALIQALGAATSYRIGGETLALLSGTKVVATFRAVYLK